MPKRNVHFQRPGTPWSHPWIGTTSPQLSSCVVWEDWKSVSTGHVYLYFSELIILRLEGPAQEEAALAHPSSSATLVLGSLSS